MHGGDSRDSGLTAGCRFYLAGISGRMRLRLSTLSNNYYLARLLKTPLGKICGCGCGWVCGMLGMGSGVYMLGPPVFSASL